MSGLTSMGMGELAAAIKAKKTSASEVVDAHLSRIAEKDASIGAFLSRDDDRARADAKEVDARLARGEDPGALAGVPIAIKDVIHVKGLATTCGSKILNRFATPYDATVIRRLRNAGAIVLGKLNMDEFAMGSSNENSAFGPVRNPWDLTRVPGGSSGGSAAAVSARFAAMALGSDTGGSIRQPAAFCGVVGLKPTYGRVSRYGLVAFASSLDQIGPLTRSCADAALSLSVIAGQDVHDATSSPRVVEDYGAALGESARGLRIGVPRDFLKGVDAGVMAEFDKSIAALQADGAAIVDIALPNAPHAIATYYLVATAEASSNLARFDGVRYGLRTESAASKSSLKDMYGETRDAGFGPEVKRRIILGTFVLSSGYYDAYYLRAQKVRTLIRRDFETAFASCDVIATPTTPSPAFKLGEKTANPLEMYLADVFTVPANLAGVPGLSVPCGFSNGLPVGLQFVGPMFQEATLLRAGHALERLMGAAAAQPPV
ncbi:MAG: Asp-tRNA(Asn)/Glu-tRNA(Gln) amidotransferase subunit GatA [Vicinamibacteria bacterium]|nr:Asp-tRNA(Asn)/Glu-tRNA(Gln) amidotransferase subunit GatA [Vicinamibacteria bacterium]